MKFLLVAFHYPPVQGSTGVHRAVALSRYLKEFGWDVTVLTAAERAYPQTRAENSKLIPAGVNVERAFALDTRRHLSLFGRYPMSLSLPDRWRTWIPGAMRRVDSLFRRWRPVVVMTTFPIASAHEIGLQIQQRFGIPWIADFRDPMVQDGYPTEPSVYAAYDRIEKAVFRHAALVTVTTPGAAELYAARYPEFPRESLSVLSNGFDEEAFAAINASAAAKAQSAPGKLMLLHSGLLYPKERNPEALFRAIAELSREGKLSESEAEFRFRGGGHVEKYEPMIAALGIGHLVKLLPAVPYSEALREMMEADACLLMQSSSCNQQIPAKIYEYLYAGKPILGLTDPVGDTGRLMQDLGIDSIAALDSSDAIKRLIPEFIRDIRRGARRIPSREEVMQYSRRTLTRGFADRLEQMAGAWPSNRRRSEGGSHGAA